VTRNNRRVLFCRAAIGGTSILLGAMHTDSFDLTNNRRQTEQILAFEPATPMLLAGDFNAPPDSASLAAVVGSGRFVGALHGPATFPAEDPRLRIDYVFGPSTWKLLDSRVLDDTTSDHRAVVATFAVSR
jgi:endonuclease/exonuclease/phosphatase (EEP) superfamily protein YafD